VREKRKTPKRDLVCNKQKFKKVKKYIERRTKAKKL